ncbi:DUF1349 domain-containing protein [Deinococcus aestuarii]|uniref:DUF1349 domain-containing protein n=1 Tax=Deinococcus aestuarii TaxID=2774531 RepID=UPI001FE43580|nr:DUF1349 domain-containing protein [Deinococcus aestuarii]
MWREMTWHAPPPHAAIGEDGALEVRTGNRTDFWRATHYGFTRDDGHALLADAPPEFTASVRVRGEYEELYDQAGLMVRANEAHWLKAGVEFVGRQQWSAVVTRDASDWSVTPTGDHPETTFRVTRRADALIVHARPEGQERWTLLRVALFPPELPARVGVMACSPQRADFHVTFRDFRLTAPDPRPLHEMAGP